MSLIDYDAIVTTVRDLIANTGREVTFRTLEPIESDPEKPWKPTPEASDVIAHATFVPLSSLQELGITVEDSELLKRAKQACIAAAHEATDLAGSHTIIDRDECWRVVWATSLCPGATVLLHAFVLSK